jgi:hypothetical protein
MYSKPYCRFSGVTERGLPILIQAAGGGKRWHSVPVPSSQILQG